MYDTKTELPEKTRLGESSFLEFKEVHFAGKEPTIELFDNAELRLTIHAAQREPRR